MRRRRVRVCGEPIRFIATLEHTPENCWAREEHEEMARDWIGSMDERAGERDVELHGTYVTPNEHKLYFILDADTVDGISGFLDSPFLEDHTGHVAPVMTLGRAEETILQG